MLELKHISKKFDDCIVLNDISLTLPDVGFIGIKGESGCGKSTLLYIIGMLDTHFDGEVLYNGEVIKDQKAFIRNHVSYMMQNKDVISSMTVKENILLGCMISHKFYQRTQLKKIVHQLGIKDLLNRYPSQLSGGQLKRVSIAKAFMKNSSILLADEPTGALHQSQADEVMSLLKKVSQEKLVIIVSHDPLLLEKYCDSLLELKNGKLLGEVKEGVKQNTQSFPYKHYSLLIYPFRQLLSQKNKLVCLFLFQWILIVSFFLILTAMNGILDSLNQSEIHSVNAYMMTIENKEKTPFTSLPIISHSYVDYHYDLEQLSLIVQSKNISASLSFLPNNTNHIQLKQGRLPYNNNEVIITNSFHYQIGETIHIQYDNYQKDMTVVGIIEPMLFQEEEIYCLRSLKNELSFLLNAYSIDVEGQNSQELYQELSHHYIVYSDVIERVNNYQNILLLAKIVAFVFIGVSLIVSLLLIGIVESIIYYERKHDVAYLLSLGMSFQRLFVLSMLEAFLLGMIIVVGGSLLSHFIYIYINDVYDLKSHFYFELKYKKIGFYIYDIYFFIGLIYQLIVLLGALMPIVRMMKVDMIDVLREE